MSSKRFFINNIDTLISEALLKELTKGEEEIEPTHMATYIQDSRLHKPRGI